MASVGRSQNVPVTGRDLSLGWLLLVALQVAACAELPSSPTAHPGAAVVEYKRDFNRWAKGMTNAIDGWQSCRQQGGSCQPDLNRIEVETTAGAEVVTVIVNGRAVARSMPLCLVKANTEVGLLLSSLRSATSRGFGGLESSNGAQLAVVDTDLRSDRTSLRDISAQIEGAIC